MQLKGIQILGIILVVIALIQTYIFYKKKRYNIWDFLLWIGIWISAAITFIYPGIASFVLPALTLQTSLFATLILSTIVAYVLLFIIYGSLKDVQKKVAEIAQVHAILRYDFENVYSMQGNEENNELPDEDLKTPHEP
jgi:hypothetical protein